MNVENLAVNKISDLISKCPHLEAYLDQNDRTPLTDGHIDIHWSDKTHTIANFRGRVTVQVKGRTFPPKSKPPTNFSVSRSDLEAYVKDSGVLYFVVFIEKKTGKRKCFYALLNPFKTMSIIAGMKESQKTVGVRLKPLPKDPSSIEAILALAYQTRSESPEMKVDSKLLVDIRELTLYSDGKLDLDAPITLKQAEIDFSVVAKTVGGMSVPIDGEFRIIPSSYIGEATDLKLSSGIFVFHQPMRRRIDANTVELILSKGLTIRQPEDTKNRSGSISLKTCGTVEDRFNDTGFMLACMENGGFMINDHEVKIEVESANEDGGLRGYFGYIKSLRDVLKYFGADASLIDPETLDERRGQQLLELHDILVAKTKELGSIDRPGRIRQPVGDWSLDLLVVQDAESKQWKCHGLFDSDLGQQFVMSEEQDSGETKFSRVTPYEVLDAEWLPYTLNLRLENLVDAYEDISGYPETTTRANMTVLRLIQAADKVDLRKTEFLNAANSLNEWLIGKEGDRAIHLINRWQIICRTGSLNQEDRKAIRALKRAVHQPGQDTLPQVETACAILLGDQEEADDCFRLLTKEQQESMRSWPIWTLYSALEANQLSELGTTAPQRSLEA